MLKYLDGYRNLWQSKERALSYSVMRGSINRTRLKGHEDATSTPPTKRARGCLEPFDSQDLQGDANCKDLVISNASCLDIEKRDFTKPSFGREKLKSMRGHFQMTQSQVKPPDEVKERNMLMDNMSLKNMLSFLDEEEALLTQLQSKMSDELSRLQVEEHVFLHTIKILGETNDASSNKTSENQQQSEHQELTNAMNAALKENGECNDRQSG